MFLDTIFYLNVLLIVTSIVFNKYYIFEKIFSH